MKVHNLVVTGSLQSGGENITSISSSVASTVSNVSSSVSASISLLSSSLMTSMNNLSSSMVSVMATTGSNIFVGNQTISGSIVPAVNGAYDLGSSTHEFRHLYLSSASLYIDGTKVLGSTTQELQITTDAGQSFKILEAGSDTITLQAADGNITLATSGGGDVILDPTTGVIALKGTTTIYAGNRVLSSDGNAIHFGNSVTMTGSLVVTGFIETQELRTTYISSSILYRSGSTKFGDELGDTHSFTGSLLVSGSISVPGSGLVSGSSQISFGSVSGVPSGLVSGSSQVLSGTGIWSGSAQLPSGTVSGSAQITLSSTTGYGSILNQAVLTTSSPTFSGIYVNQASATNSTTATIRQTTAGGNGNQDIGLVVDIQGANDLDRILNLRYYNGSTYTSRFSVLRDGKVGIGNINPVAGMYLAQYGTNWDDDSQYTKPSGNVFLSMGYSVSDAHNWFGIRGNYGSSSGTANLLLQANYRDIGSQAGHYLTSTATGLGASYFAIGKLETTTSTSTPPNKIEQLIITRAGTLQIKPNTIGTSDTSDRSVIIGSRPSSSSIASLGFDTGGTYRGDFDFSSSDGNLSWWSYNGSSWTEKWRSTPSSGFNIYNSALSLTETGVSSFSISYSSGKTQFGMDSAGTDGFYFRSYSSGAYADRFIIKSSGEVNVRGTILPVSDATYNLGSTSLRWNNLYTTDLHLSNEGKQNVVDGTWGDWTLQEGENDIFMLNNRSGEKFKIKLEKITE